MLQYLLILGRDVAAHTVHKKLTLQLLHPVPIRQRLHKHLADPYHLQEHCDLTIHLGDGSWGHPKR